MTNDALIIFMLLLGSVFITLLAVMFGAWLSYRLLRPGQAFWSDDNETDKKTPETVDDNTDRKSIRTLGDELVA